jgi:hypothetical protein
LIYGTLGVKTSLRLYGRLILFIFVTGHFLNHGLDLISIDAMVARIKFLRLSSFDTWPASAYMLDFAYTHAIPKS